MVYLDPRLYRKVFEQCTWIHDSIGRFLNSVLGSTPPPEKLSLFLRPLASEGETSPYRARVATSNRIAMIEHSFCSKAQIPEVTTSNRIAMIEHYECKSSASGEQKA